MLTMEMIKNCNHIHFVGIGGVSSSALAQWLCLSGKKVTGSDKVKSVYTDKLADMGIQIEIPTCENLVKNSGLVVTNSAIAKDDKEIEIAKKFGIPVVCRNELLGLIFDSFSKNIAVCGMHGKTTATAMIAHCLKVAKQKPTAFVGGWCNQLGGNFVQGNGKFCVAEACEYKANFLTMHPFITCVLNIDFDHTDFFKDVNHVKQVFLQFAQNTKRGGVLVVNGDQKEIKDFGGVTFGFDDGNIYRATNLACNGGKYTFSVLKHGRFYVEIELSVYGRHNVYNALCTFATLDLLGFSRQTIAHVLQTFEGVDRRFSLYKSKTNVVVDYAHHPNEIRAFLKTINDMGFDKKFLVFQPHTYTRTQALFDHFVNVLEGDEIFVLPTFAARENKIDGCDGSDLALALKNKNKNATFCKNKKLLAKRLLKKVKQNDVIMLVGAGDVDQMKNMFD